jgi:hypothetical protein
MAACWREKTHRSRREGVLVKIIGLEESPMFHRTLVLVRPFHALLEGWMRVLDLVPAT